MLQIDKQFNFQNCLPISFSVVWVKIELEQGLPDVSNDKSKVMTKIYGQI